MSALSREFITFAVACEAIRFGAFRTKAGRQSPYFFNTGVFDDGERLRALAQFYAKAIVASGLPFDMLYGAAYKGIPLVAGTAIALAEAGFTVVLTGRRREPLEEAARAWFRSDRCKDAIRKKVAHMYPAHEVADFSTRFFELVKQSVADDEKEGKK